MRTLSEIARHPWMVIHYPIPVRDPQVKNRRVKRLTLESVLIHFSRRVLIEIALTLSLGVPLASNPARVSGAVHL